jgi:heme A synthase
MVHTLFDLPFAGIFVAIAVPYTLAAFIICWISQRTPLRGKVQSLSGVVAPFFGSVGILFGLLTGFLASDISDRNRQASRVMLAESDGLHATQTLSIASVGDMAAIREALRAYAQSILKDEWEHMDQGRSPKTEAAFGELLRRVSDPAIARDSGQAVQTALLAGVARLGSARSDRLALSEDRTSGLKWLTVLLLGIITQVSIGIVHLDKPRAQIASLVVFSGAAIIALTLIAAQELPYSGAAKVSPWLITDFLDTTTVAVPPAQ